MPVSITTAGVAVAELYRSVYASLEGIPYDASSRSNVALELTRMTLPLLNIVEEPASELPEPAAGGPGGSGPGRSGLALAGHPDGENPADA